MMLRKRGWLTALLLVVLTCGLAQAMPYGPFKRQLPDCEQFTNCSTCTAKGGCGWCLRPTTGSLLNGTCTAGENDGPTDPHTCSRWFYQDCHNLDVCEATTCENCTAQKGCGWCASSNFCLPGNSTGPDPAQGGVCAKPYWLWGDICPLEPTASPSTTPSAPPTPSQTPSASPTPSVSPSHTPSASPSPSPDMSDTCHTFLNCSACVGGSKCLWCPTSKTCFNSTKPSSCMDPGENTCYDEFCATFTTCDDCAKQTVCGWCNYTKCVAGNNARPTRDKCTAYQYGNCAPIPCHRFADCPLCTQPGNTHCAWCDPALQCLSITNPPPQPGDPACPHDWFYEECPAPVDCALYTTCLDCTDYNQDCYWCTDGKGGKGFCSWFSPTDHVCMRDQKKCSTTPGKNSGSDGLGGGAIAGIVIGTLCGVAILPASAIVWYKYYWSRRHYYVTLA